VSAQVTVLGMATVDDPGLVGSFASLVSTTAGAQHVTYYDRSYHRLKYARCAAACTVAANWSRAVIDQSADVGWYSSLVVRGGIRHVVYLDVTNQRLKYATCSTGCLSESNWQKGPIDRGPALGQSSMFVDGAGRRHVSYVESGGAVRYATCLSACTGAANWQIVTVDPDAVGEGTAITLDPGGRRHISYGSDGDLKYATCNISCTNAANWETLKIDEQTTGGSSSAIAIGPDGSRHVSYYDASNSALRYARCAANCSNSAGWGHVLVDGASTSVGTYTSLAVGGDGKVHVSYFDQTNGDLKYASCASGCLTARNWQRQTLDSQGQVGSFSSLKLVAGTLHIAYHDLTLGDLKYLELAP
jgi:hypothetical protein